MAGLIILAAVFYRERAAYLDLGYHVVTYLLTHDFFVQNQRFGSALTQAVPLLAIRLGAPLWTVLVAYSVTFPLLAVGVFCLAAYGLRTERAALAVPLLATLLVSHLFFWAQSELQQALLWLVGWWALLSTTARVGVNGRSAVLAALVPVLVYFHPLLLIPLLFVWGYDWLLRPHRRRQWLNYLVPAGAVLLHRHRTHTLDATSYDAQRMELGALIERLPHLWSLPSFRHLGHLLYTELWPLLGVLGVLTVFYLRQPLRSGAWLRLGWVLGFVAGFAALVIVAYPNWGEETYLSNLLQPLALFVVVPLTAEVLPAAGLRARRAALGLGIFFVGRLLTIWFAREPFVAYRLWLEHLIAYTRQLPERKIVLHQANVDPWHRRAPSWASSYESLLLSALSGPTAAQEVMVTDRPNEYAWGFAQDSLMLLCWNAVPLRELPAPYFQLPPTPTRLLTTAPPADTLALRALVRGAAGQVRLRATATMPDHVAPGEEFALPVEVVASAAHPVPSGGLDGPHPTLLSYRFWRDDWPQVLITALTTPLEVDVVAPWTQLLQIRAPREPGDYLLELRLVSRDFADWPVSNQQRYPVRVR